MIKIWNLPSSAKYILPLYKDGSVSESDEPIPKSQKVNLFKKEARPNSRRMSNRIRSNETLDLYRKSFEKKFAIGEHQQLRVKCFSKHKRKSTRVNPFI